MKSKNILQFKCRRLCFVLKSKIIFFHFFINPKFVFKKLKIIQQTDFLFLLGYGEGGDIFNLLTNAFCEDFRYST